jgi:hypothetical protein
MKDEATILPFIGFAVSAFLAARVCIIYNLRLSRAAKRLKQAYVAVGREWDYNISDFAFRWRLFRRPESILESSDLPEIREAKVDLIHCSAGAFHTLWKAIKIMLWGFGITILLSLVESGIRHFL